MDKVDSVVVTRKRIVPPTEVGDTLAKAVNEARRLEHSIEIVQKRITQLESYNALGPAATAREGLERLERSLERTRRRIELLRGHYMAGLPADEVALGHKKHKKQLRLAVAPVPEMILDSVNGEAPDAFALPDEPKITVPATKTEAARIAKLDALRKKIEVLARSVAKAERTLSRLHAQHVFVATRSPVEIRDFVTAYNDDAEIVAQLVRLKREISEKIEKYDSKAASDRARALELSVRTDLPEETRNTLTTTYNASAKRAKEKSKDLHDTQLVYVEEELAAWRGKPLRPDGTHQERPQRPSIRLLRKLDNLEFGEETAEERASLLAKLAQVSQVLPENVLTETFATSHGTIPTLARLPPVLRRGAKLLKTIEDYTMLLSQARENVKLANHTCWVYKNRHAAAKAELARLT